MVERAGKIGDGPYAGAGAAADCGSMEGSVDGQVRVVYLVRQAPGWLLAAEGSERPIAAFGDLGEALDAATAGEGPVRVVVRDGWAAGSGMEAA